MRLAVELLNAFRQAVAQHCLETIFASIVKRSFVVLALELHHRKRFLQPCDFSFGLRASHLEQLLAGSVGRGAFLRHRDKLLDVFNFEARFLQAIDDAQQFKLILVELPFTSRASDWRRALLRRSNEAWKPECRAFQTLVRLQTCRFPSKNP